ncbi:hypothetical protein L345_14192 [Ophiophagus hannah]|uniref:Secreted protein n=1 Tax=Ophiophagus hannah TaxID=8665 RepID=V8NEL8_OPHHA|nr:hypothetical protein L345_14192 [Ophiophagus hannah]
MDRFFFFLVLGILVGLVCCSEKGGRYGEEKESLLSRSKRSKLWHRSCTCPEHRNLHPHRKSKKHALRKTKCKRFLRHCAFNGMHVPL